MRFLLSVLLLCSSVFGRGLLSGNCEQGGNTVTILGAQSTTFVQASFPACTVEVFVIGSGTPATIYSSSSGSPLGNPFVANADGSYVFYADDGNYEIHISGLSILLPFIRYGTIGTGGPLTTNVSQTPTANFIPQARGTALIDIGWLPRTGNGPKVATSTGVLNNGSLVSIDAFGNLIDAGALLSQIVTKAGANTYSGGFLQDMSTVQFKPPLSLFASLPSASLNTNVVYMVTDCLTSSCTAGGGAFREWLVSNGTTWQNTGGGGGGTVDALAIQEATLLVVSSGSGTAYVGTPTTTNSAYAVGETFLWKPDVTNTGTTPTLNVSSLGAKTIVHKVDSSTLAVSELDTSAYCTSIYDGTNMLTTGCFTGPGTITITGNTSPATPSGTNGNITFDNVHKVIKSIAADTTTSASVIPNACAGGDVQSIDSNGAITCVSRYKTCVIDNDTQSGTALIAAQFSGGCFFPKAATLIEVDVFGGTGVIGGSVSTTGTSSINIQKYTPNGGATTTLLSGALATASGYACALTTISGTCTTGTTSSGSVTISTTSVSSGDWVRVSAATPDSTQTWYRIAVVYTVN